MGMLQHIVRQHVRCPEFPHPAQRCLAGPSESQHRGRAAVDHRAVAVELLGRETPQGSRHKVYSTLCLQLLADCVVPLREVVDGLAAVVLELVAAGVVRHQGQELLHVSSAQECLSPGVVRVVVRQQPVGVVHSLVLKPKRERPRFVVPAARVAHGPQQHLNAVQRPALVCHQLCALAAGIDIVRKCAQRILEDLVVLLPLAVVQNLENKPEAACCCEARSALGRRHTKEPGKRADCFQRVAV
mmetsp:Transcript_93810/g.265331  ORF Transcript_93810/g.265331 Transcript_93810/m.265331 type:complete len:243 (-) Transcript_93810:528-1256(-)